MRYAALFILNSQDIYNVYAHSYQHVIGNVASWQEGWWATVACLCLRGFALGAMVSLKPKDIYVRDILILSLNKVLDS